jgi:RNA polymerase sigma factor (TIGR02999 family)
MSDVTFILQRLNDGDQRAMDELIPLVYDDLRERARLYMARRRGGHTLQPTALVHEAFAKLVAGEQRGRWRTGRHFFNAAAEAMRQILVDHARRRSAAKRGGDRPKVELDASELAWDEPGSPSDGDDGPDWEALDRALIELKEMDSRRYQVVMLRYFGGLTDAQVAEALGVTDRTVQRDWTTARAFLRARVEGDGSCGGGP